MQTCPECGTPNEAGELFCGNCGSYLEWAAGEAPAPADAAAPGMPAPTASEPDDAVASEPDDAAGSDADADADADASGSDPTDGLGAEVPAAGSSPARGAAGAGAAGVAAGALAAAADRATGGHAARVTGAAGGAKRSGGSHLLRDLAGRAGIDTSGVTSARQVAGAARDVAGARTPRSDATPESATTAATGAAAATAPDGGGGAVTTPAVTTPGVTTPGATRPAPGPSRPAPGPSRPSAGAGPRKPAAVRPGAPAPRRRVPPPVADEPPPAPGDLICGSCAAGNVPTRKFCRRCGASLADAPVQAQRSWWRRMLRPDRRPGPAAGTRPRSRRRRRFPTGLVTTLVVLALLVGGGWVFRDRIADGYAAALDRISGDTEVVPLHEVGFSSEAEGRLATQARDGVVDRSWAPAPLGEAAAGEWVQFAFDEPFRLVHVLVTSGNSDDEEVRRTEGRPADIRLEMHTTGGTEPVVRNVRLEDTGGAQTVSVGGVDDVEAVRVTILSAYGATPEVPVALAEVEFRGRA
ncbi:zinc ribbon domain-containing protein [Georgenia faecalis]|uniref:zinc ribbon domain-containing protein n=1 Tax=Georgenia faecalis TaxID=2483799 RepID=UPI000FD94A2E|nr:zinc ribbon domain-containing protein [Georgenia faecalis]